MARRKPSKPAAGLEPSQRQLRAGELVRHALIEILTREELRDPDLQGVSITVGEVRCSPDLKHAKVFCIPLGDETVEGRDRLAAALNRASGFLRSRLAKSVDLKFTPNLHFVADDSYDAAIEIDRLLDQPEVKRDLDS